MDVFFELFDLASGNVIDDFSTEEDALEALRAAQRDHGTEAIKDVALLRFDSGHPTLVAMEHDLVERVTESSHGERIRVG
ncbi:MAG: hypothetical protein H0T18_02390 [Chloroflexia bacterium]|nr:hypothetical protein [Chloroflexia bacterium]